MSILRFLLWALLKRPERELTIPPIMGPFDSPEGTYGVTSGGKRIPWGVDYRSKPPKDRAARELERMCKP